MSQSVLRIFTRFVCIVRLSVLIVNLFCLSVSNVCLSVLPMSVYLYCQCQPFLSSLLNGLSVRLSFLMSDNLSYLVYMCYLIVYLSVFQCRSVCIVNVSLSNLFFLNVMCVYLSCLSICIFSLSALLVHGLKGSWLKVSELVLWNPFLTR